MTAELGKFEQYFTAYRRILASTPGPSRMPVFADAATEAAKYVSQGLDRTVAADELTEMATTYELGEPDVVQDTIARAFERIIEEPPPEEKPHRNGKAGSIRFLSKADFIGGFRPPDYLIEGMLQRRFVYALTGQTGHAKTAIALLLAELVSSEAATFLGRHRVERGRVIYFVGENPDDIRMRVIGADSQRTGDDPRADRITFIPGQFNIGLAHPIIAKYAEAIAGVDLILIDTSAAYFLGQDEVSNTQMGAHARMLRKLTELPGGPCVVVLCHPIKYVTDPSQLLPRGGGAFLAEMDGNLTAWKHDDTLIELHHNKIRGPGFEAMTFKLETIRTDELTDNKGRRLPTVRAVAITQSEEDQQLNKAGNDEDRVLAVRLKAGEENLSIAEIATRCEWTWADGAPAKSRVQRALDRLEKAKPALMYRDRGQFKLTEKGKEAARKAALRLLAEEERRRTDQMAMDLQ